MAKKEKTEKVNYEEVVQVERPEFPFKIERKVVNGKTVVVPEMKNWTAQQKLQFKEYSKKMRLYKRQKLVVPAVNAAYRTGFNAGLKEGIKQGRAKATEKVDKIKAEITIAKNAEKIAKTKARLAKLEGK